MSHSQEHGAVDFARVLHDRALRSPDVTGFRFVAEDGSAVETTYAGLDARARAVAARVTADGARHTGPALLLYAPGNEYLAGLFGCFHAGVPAVPAFPPDPTRLARTLPRLAAIIEDAGARTVLTTSDIAPLVEEWLTIGLGGHAPRVIVTDTTGEGEGYGAGEPSPAGGADGPALLQYTSGSTALPRGVVLTHAQLLSNCAQIAHGFGIHPDSSGGLWLPPYHDMGLIGGILTPLSSGIPVTLMSPVTFLRRPLSWLRMVSRYRATITGGPNFAYDLCVRRATDAEVAELDLSCVELTFTGAEPVRAETMRRFAERFAPSGFRPESFYPCYGLAEATLFVTGGRPLGGWRTVPLAREALEDNGTARPAAAGEASRPAVSCGSPSPGARVRVVDPANGEPLAEGAVGEVWVDSPSVAEGYWRRPEETAATFGATTADGEGPYLRTGDLGFVLEGELFLAGRMKDLIVVNGRNYHPVDIERACETAVAGIRRNCGAAFAVEDEQGAAERLVLVYEAEAGAGAGAVRGAGDVEDHAAVLDGIRRTVSRELSLPPHAVVLIRPRTIPKTSSGKVQRWLARRQYLDGELDELARWQFEHR
ncbi:fatty acyl-AMP ligase [Streptomyces sp. NPDC048172]|uniref:fatty acyl-AMP ligase n=1 Tax=Streptomyces sp. NPDC048172 TaxID=3365505 RepID=UPI003717AF72